MCILLSSPLCTYLAVSFLASLWLAWTSFFWTSFHSLSSPSLGIWPGEGFYVPDPCELTFANTLLLSNAAISLGNAFISLEISSSFLIFFSLFSFILAWTFISLQIKEFRIMGLSINDSVYSCVFFFLTGLHFFHLVVGLLLLSLLSWSSSFPHLLGLLLFGYLGKGPKKTNNTEPVKDGNKSKRSRLRVPKLDHRQENRLLVWQGTRNLGE